MTSRSEDPVTTPLPQSVALRAAENELQALRGSLRKAAEFIHDQAHDFAARYALALSLGLPLPTPAPTQHSLVDQNLNDALATVASEIGRTDNKTSFLLAFNGAVIAGLVGSADKVPLLCLVTGGLAVLVLAVSTVLLLLVVTPRLHGADRASFPYWARCDTQQIRAEMSDDRRADRLRVLSQIALPKFQGLGLAIRLSLAAVVLIVIAVIALIVTALA
ncbi:Pycsar system effector family protein [Streptomyces sp. NPDC005483]|uniref:Pycsar system effector family protein n=1 Tax=Streptomyces sp. NPDC005483 TaxID=3154882 RepID=UPI00339FEA98